MTQLANENGNWLSSRKTFQDRIDGRRAKGSLLIKKISP